MDYNTWANETLDRAEEFYNTIANKLDKPASWYAARTVTVGGSDLGAILGLNPYKTAIDVFLEKTMQIEPKCGTFATRIGTATESVIYNEIPNLISGELLGGCTSINPEKPWQVAQHDNIGIFAQIDHDRPVIVECKTANNMGDFGPGCEIVNGAITSTDNKIPYSYEVQVRYGLHVRNAAGEKTDHAVLALWYKPRNSINLYIIKHDKEIDAEIAHAADEFVLNNLMTGKAPEPQAREIVEAFLTTKPEKNDLVEIKQTNTVLLNALDVFRAASEKEKEYKEQKDKAAEIIKANIGAHMGLTLGGNTVATWNFRKGVTRIDAKALQTEMPSIYAKYAKTGEPSRALSVK